MIAEQNGFVCVCGLQVKCEKLINANTQWRKEYDVLVCHHEKAKTDLAVAQVETECCRKQINELKNIISKVKCEVTERPNNDTTFVELLKQQVVAYKEDFTQTDQELTTAKKEIAKLKRELHKVSSQNVQLAFETRNLKSKYICVQNENERIISQLRVVTNSAQNENALSYNATAIGQVYTLQRDGTKNAENKQEITNHVESKTME